MYVKNDKLWYVYILQCKDNSFYIGCTDDLERRFEQHNKGYVKSTKMKLPVLIVTHLTFTNKYTAFNFEKYLKSGSGIAFRNKRLV
ncbi:GIY-YIG nuclease family protein [Planktosalinus lacus]|uniref:Excinuclease ABC subunit C n=1 Tax=Planktosalinus lacus TaxID=1526573 RepID=A0A8J2Y7W8_9FLAO|nr:GIY-YIG nuclease family protein [Planktosalinus lacus]GGD98938.1 excinuclease ABC subunit C [Planktosalinus lacus]